MNLFGHGPRKSFIAGHLEAGVLRSLQEGRVPEKESRLGESYKTADDKG